MRKGKRNANCCSFAYRSRSSLFLGCKLQSGDALGWCDPHGKVYVSPHGTLAADGWRRENVHFAACCSCSCIAAAVAGCFTYFITPPPRVETEEQSVPTRPRRDGAAAGTPARAGRDRSAEDFLRAAEAILRPLSDAQASAAPMNCQSLGTSHCENGVQSRGNAGSPRSGAEGVQCMGNENSNAQNNQKCR